VTDAQNLLRYETSPYLLQHAQNPVHWRPWSAAVLAEAQAADRPVLLSVGYASCHWCHVMAHESFEDPETAALMNALFIPVKVDREERPDIDRLCMDALHAMGEPGGWPLTLFLTPEGAPFWGGTYFPPVARWGRPSFRDVLRGVAEAYRTQKPAIGRSTAALRAALSRHAAAAPGAGIDPATLDAATAALLAALDPVHGGLAGAPKFPNFPLFRFLWQESFRTGSAASRNATLLLLRRLTAGGIYDALAGGCCRYATDGSWLVPHFEKMLTDNAQLLELLALAVAATAEPELRRRGEETAGWLLEEMRATPAPAFASSLDADSAGGEGAYYLWTAAEIEAVLGPAAAPFAAAYGVTAEGNWQRGANILHRVSPPASAATEASLAASRALLLAARRRRPPPARDDKLLADGNGLAIAALCRAAAVFAKPEWIGPAAAAFDFLWQRLVDASGRIGHAWCAGRASAPGLLDDQAAMARAALALFEATGAAERLRQAQILATAAERFFAADDGSFYLTAGDAAEPLHAALCRPRTAACGAVPSGVGLLAEVFARLFHLTGEARWAIRARRLLAAFSGLGEALSGAPTLLAAADLLEAATVVVVAGADDHPAAQALLAAALAAPDPAVVVVRGATQPLPEGHPAFAKQPPAAAAAAAFVCAGGVCDSAIVEPARLAARLAARRQ
jgi:hypothetical protein